MNLSDRIYKGSKRVARAQAVPQWAAIWPLFWGILVAWAVLCFAGQIHAKELDVKPKDEAERRAQLYEVRTQLIPKLEEFIRTHPTDARLVEYQLRLGESYFEIAKFHEYSNQAQASKAFMKK